MKTLIALCLLLLAVIAHGQNLPTATTTAASASGQFQVFAPHPYAGRLGAPSAFNDTNIIRLEPTLLAVSAERVRSILWRELKITGPWQQKVFFILRPARSTADPVTIRTVISMEGWAVRVELPDHLSRQQLIRTLAEAVLLEYANRTGTEQAAEIPAWLAEGFGFHLLANYSTELVLEAPRYNANGVAFTQVATSQQRVSELERAHKILVGETPLTFEQLSWPDDQQLQGGGRARYLASAQVFIVSLLRLPDGPACFRNFLTALPSYRNWQLAFLRGFHPHFTRLLDVDKWWSLEAAHFVGRDITQTWSVEASWSKLAATLREPINRYADTNALPERASLSLQEILRDWKPSEQKAAVRRIASDLAAMRLRLAPELVALMDDYRSALESWLKKRGQINLGGGGARMIQPSNNSSTATIKQLNDLDARLVRMQPAEGLRKAASVR